MSWPVIDDPKGVGANDVDGNADPQGPIVDIVDVGGVSLCDIS